METWTTFGSLLFLHWNSSPYKSFSLCVAKEKGQDAFPFMNYQNLHPPGNPCSAITGRSWQVKVYPEQLAWGNVPSNRIGSLETASKVILRGACSSIVTLTTFSPTSSTITKQTPDARIADTCYLFGGNQYHIEKQKCKILHLDSNPAYNTSLFLLQSILYPQPIQKFKIKEITKSALQS